MDSSLVENEAPVPAEAHHQQNGTSSATDNFEAPKTPTSSFGPPKLLSYRYAMVFWGTLGFINLYFQRVNLSGKIF